MDETNKIEMNIVAIIFLCVGLISGIILHKSFIKYFSKKEEIRQVEVKKDEINYDVINYRLNCVKKSMETIWEGNHITVSCDLYEPMGDVNYGTN